jgi:hypothetical protein
MDNIEKVESAGWSFYFLDDGFGPTGWWVCKGLFSRPDLETSIFDTKDLAAKAALETWPSLFSDEADQLDLCEMFQDRED